MDRVGFANRMGFGAVVEGYYYDDLESGVLVCCSQVSSNCGMVPSGL